MTKSGERMELFHHAPSPKRERRAAATKSRPAREKFVTLEYHDPEASLSVTSAFKRGR
jgi:hypothetical protein